jgi:hypothetical protein
MKRLLLLFIVSISTLQVWAQGEDLELNCIHPESLQNHSSPK